MQYQLFLFFFIFGIGFFSFSDAIAIASPKETGKPRTINYYLSELSLSNALLTQLARYDVLILSPSQIIAYPQLIRELHTRHPGIIILAYVPSQSYNTKYWPQDSIFRTIRVHDSWWLRDSRGTILSAWEGIHNINLDPAWSEYFLTFVRERIADVPGVDGIFFDMVSHNISWINHGDIDLDANGVQDTPVQADALWLNRTQYFFKRAREIMPRTYIVTNGTSASAIQPFVNGRMFETFPTPWEGDGSWTTVMNGVANNKTKNVLPQLTLFNSNTNNTGMVDYRAVRFGLASSLLENGYFGYDFGDKHHGQLWWYDEYDTNLGKPLNRPIGMVTAGSNEIKYHPDIWRRDFEHGIALVNSTPELVNVALGGEFEKINGNQDKMVNDGSIVSETELGPNDGLLLLKTTSRLDDVLFTNGAFARFYFPDGNRVRNGFFVFEDTYRGGDQILHTDLDGNGERDTLVVSGNKILAWRDDGQPFFKIYPYTANYTGSFQIGISDSDANGSQELFVAPRSGKYPLKVYDLIGEESKPAWYPLGSNYRGSYSFAVLGNGLTTHFVIGTGQIVTVYDRDFKKIQSWKVPGKKENKSMLVATGDILGNGQPMIVVGLVEGNTTRLLFYLPDGSTYGKPLVLSSRGTELRLSDVNFDGKDDIIVMTNSPL